MPSRTPEESFHEYVYRAHLRMKAALVAKKRADEGASEFDASNVTKSVKEMFLQEAKSMLVKAENYCKNGKLGSE